MRCKECADSGYVWADEERTLYKPCECREARLRTTFFAPFPPGVAYITSSFIETYKAMPFVHVTTNGLPEGWGLMRGLLAVGYYEDIQVSHCTIRDLADASTHSGREDDPLSGKEGKIQKCKLLIVSLDKFIKSEAYNDILTDFLNDRIRYQRPTLVLQTSPGILVNSFNQDILKGWSTYHQTTQEKILIDEMTGGRLPQ